MVELNKVFSIKDVVIDRNKEDKDFSIAEIWALSEGNNSHRNPFSREVLEKYAYTFKGKFIIGKYDKFIVDTKAHEVQEDIYGYVSVTEEPQFKTKIVDGEEKEFVVVKALISKIYAKEIVDMFRLDNKRSVSCEFSCALEYDEDEYGRPLDENGLPMDIDNPILAYSISGITILGKKINPSVRGADIVMKRFSEDSNKLELENMSKGDIMEENKEFSEQPKDEDIVMEEEVMSEDTNTEEMSCGKEEELSEEDKEMAEKTDDTESSEDKEMSEEEVEQEKEMSEETKEFSEEQEQEEVVEENSEKTFEEQEQQDEITEVEKTFAEQALEFAEEDYKEFVEKLFSSEVKEFVEQVVELKKFMDERIKADTEKRFSEIMVEPKLCLGEKAYNVLFEEGSKLNLSELDAFETKVKAFCEDVPKKDNKSEEELLTFSCDDVTNKQESELTADDIYKKYL